MSRTGLIIWYDPDLKDYRKGDLQEFERSRSESDDPGQFQILFKLRENSMELADRIIGTLTREKQNTVT